MRRGALSFTTSVAALLAALLLASCASVPPVGTVSPDITPSPTAPTPTAPAVTDDEPAPTPPIPYPPPTVTVRMDNQAETMTAWYYLPYTFSVTIDAPDASATYYTLDGTTPTEDSARYTEGAVLAFSGVGEVLIRAVNVYADGVVSDVTTRGFALDDAERIAAKIAEEQILRARCAEILDEITRDELSDYDKILAAHDWVVLSAEYEYEREAFLHGDNPDYVQEYTPQEAFVRLPPRSSVFICEDYAYLLQFLLHEIGIACYAVHGDAADGQAHVWNLVKLGGDWYHVDPTWDEGGGNTVRHGYFLRSDETMRASRTWAFADFPTAVADYDKRTK